MKSIVPLKYEIFLWKVFISCFSCVLSLVLHLAHSLCLINVVFCCCFFVVFLLLLFCFFLLYVWRLFGHYFVPPLSFFGVSGELYFEIVEFPGYFAHKRMRKDDSRGNTNKIYKL